MAATPRATSIFLNAQMLTLDPHLPRAEALAVQGERILAVGRQDEILAWAGPQTSTENLHGQLVIPGLQDSHLHLLSWGWTLDGVQLAGVRSIPEVIARGQAYLRENPGREWIVGRGFNEELFSSRRLPTKEDLDQISRTHPVLFTRVCGHICCVNSQALQLAGIGASTADPPGGRIDREDQTGEPTGVLRENAIELVTRLLPSPTVEDLKRVIRRASAAAAALGLTTVQSNDLHGAADLQDRLQAYRELDQSGELPIRIILQATIPTLADLRAYLDLYHSFRPSSKLQLGPLKLFADGSLGGRTAALSRPYADDPQTDGMLIYEQEELNELICTAAQHNLQVAVHAIGDRALDQVLNGFARARELYPAWSRRPRVIHAQITRADQLERMAKLGVTADIQPIFVPTDLHFAERRIGPELARCAYSWKTMHSLGIPTAGGSDCPVEPCNPFWGMHAALTRQDREGYPPGGWLPHERLSPTEALQLFTLGPAYAAHEEGLSGSLTPGKRADFVVLPRNPLEIEPEGLLTLASTATYVGGNRVHPKD